MTRDMYVLTRVFDWPHMLTPIAVEQLKVTEVYYCAILYIFGIRLATWRVKA